MIGLIWLSGVSRGTTKTNCHWFLLQRHENSSNTAWITGKLMLTCVIIENQIQIDYNTFATLIWVWNKYFALSHSVIGSFIRLLLSPAFDCLISCWHLKIVLNTKRHTKSINFDKKKRFFLQSGLHSKADRMRSHSKSAQQNTLSVEKWSMESMLFAQWRQTPTNVLVWLSVCNASCMESL